MEITRTRSISNNLFKLQKPVSCSGTRPVLAHHHSVKFLDLNCLRNRSKLHCCTSSGHHHLRSRNRREFVSIHAAAAAASSKAETTTTTSTEEEEDGEKWLLEPVGDGDSRHIGFKVAMPNAFEIASSVVTVGRVPDKADIVIPVATVSAQHARIEKKGGNLLVTDLDSTNGTFINEKRLTPGVTTILSPGRYITFGDSNLAIFRVSKLEKSISSAEANKEEEEGPTIDSEETST